MIVYVIYIFFFLTWFSCPAHWVIVEGKRRMVRVSPSLIGPHPPPLCSHSYTVRPRSRPSALISISADETQCRPAWRRSGPTTLCAGSKGSVLQEAVTLLAADMRFLMAHRFCVAKKKNGKTKTNKNGCTVGVGFPYIVFGGYNLSCSHDALNGTEALYVPSVFISISSNRDVAKWLS